MCFTPCYLLLGQFFPNSSSVHYHALKTQRRCQRCIRPTSPRFLGCLMNNATSHRLGPVGMSREIASSLQGYSNAWYLSLLGKSRPDSVSSRCSTNTAHRVAHDRKKEGERPAWVVMNHLDCKFVHISLCEGDRCFSEWKGFVENQHFCRGNFQLVDKAVYLKCCTTFCAKFSTKNQNSFLFRKF